MFENLKARFVAKKFNIWTEKLDPNRKADSWLGNGEWYANGKLYYGHPLGIFFLSAQNDWFKGLEND
jgi:phage terminase large subunit-like protein